VAERTHGPRLVADEAGFTLVELLVSMSLLVLVLSGALLGLQTMQAQGARNSKLFDSMQAVRLASDTLASDLRNMASPTANNPAAIDAATATNLVFQVVSKVGATSANNPANVMRVRYCLDTGSPAILWRQTQTWGDATPASPPTTACPYDTSLGVSGSAAGWTTTNKLATDIVNDTSVEKPFTYNSATPATITQISTEFVVDVNATNRAPASVSLSTGVFLRNQNRVPNAQWVYQKTATKKYRFNATASTDPEGNTLNYYWYLGATPTCPLPNGFVLPDADISAIRNVAIPDYTFAATGSQRIVLVVADTGGLMSCSEQTISVT
jgi:prepilin-type N-terminal cleavage/methylation domain-containing protein